MTEVPFTTESAKEESAAVWAVLMVPEPVLNDIISTNHEVEEEPLTAVRLTMH